MTWLACTCETDVYTCAAHPHAGELRLAAGVGSERQEREAHPYIVAVIAFLITVNLAILILALS